MNSRRPTAWVATLCLAGVLSTSFAACGGGDSDPSVASATPGTDGERPNIVLVMTDDQETASVDVMPRVKAGLVKEGVSFKNAFASYPLCCPSRATFQTGQYAHNHGVLNNRPPDGGYPAFSPDETIPVWLQRAGYETGYVGKYMNDYKKTDEIPPGWDRWFGMVEPSSRYFKVRVNDQGTYTKFGKDDPDDYSTDVFSDEAVQFIEDREGADAPFFLSVGYVAPHVAKSFQPDGKHCDAKGPEPAPRHLGAFKGDRIPRGKAFNEEDVSDKPEIVKKRKKLKGNELRKKTDKYQCRLESLLSVDDGVGRILDTLRATGELDNTYIFYVSDNGFIQGEHRIDGGKAVPYEGAIQIPMIVRGPGVAEDKVTDELVSNVDVVPTFLEIAGAEPGLEVDGTQFLPVLNTPGIRDGRAVLTESDKEPEPFRGVRTGRFSYVERETGEIELYDLREDPDELDNVTGSPIYEQAEASLTILLERLRDCAGAEECSTKPQLELRVARPPGLREGGGCTSGEAQIAIAGPDLPYVVGTKVAVDGKFGPREGAEPRKISVPKGKAFEVGALVELVDGREIRLNATLDDC